MYAVYHKPSGKYVRSAWTEIKHDSIVHAWQFTNLDILKRNLGFLLGTDYEIHKFEVVEKI